MSLRPTTDVPVIEEGELGPVFEDPIPFNDPATEEEEEVGARSQGLTPFAYLHSDDDDDDDDDYYGDDEDDDNDDDNGNDDEEEARSSRTDSPSSSSSSSTDTIVPVPRSDLHFNIPSAERRILMRRLDFQLYREDQPHEFWACLLVCEMLKLHWIIEIAALSASAIEYLASKFEDFPSFWVRRWNQRTTPTNSPIMSGRLAARKSARRATRRRDGRQCILTGSRRNVRVLEFCPPDLGETNYSPEPSIWPILRFLFLPETLCRWRLALFPYGGSTRSQVQNSSNMMCLRGDILEMYKRGFVGFYPLWVSPDKTTMELELHWLPKEPGVGFRLRRLSELPTPTKDLDESHGFAVTLRDEYNEPYRIKSGHRLFLQTTDPVERPLPDFNLVMLAWYMSLIVGMTNAGEAEEIDSDDDSDVDMGGR